MEKIARICWNSRLWKRPSGIEGKSRNKETYENIHKFGHEEWLLDDKVLPDGYHYAFLQPINIQSDKYVGDTFDIHLYTINPHGEKLYVGFIKGVECIDEETNDIATKQYERKGWIKEMKEDIVYVGGNPKQLDGMRLFNIRFKFSNAQFYYSNPPVIKDSCIKSFYYKLLNMETDLKFEKESLPDNNYKLSETKSKRKAIKGTTIDPRHKKMQNAIRDLLLKEGYSSVWIEKNRVDIKARTNEGKWHFFEIKTESAKQCIREALGQILEYNNYPNTSLAEKLFIIGPNEPDRKDIEYMKTLRKRYNLPIWFRAYSFINNSLSKEI